MVIKELTFTFTVTELNTVIQALMRLPYVDAKPIIDKLEAQGQPQLDAAANES